MDKEKEAEEKEEFRYGWFGFTPSFLQVKLRDDLSLCMALSDNG